MSAPLNLDIQADASSLSLFTATVCSYSAFKPSPSLYRIGSRAIVLSSALVTLRPVRF